MLQLAQQFDHSICGGPKVGFPLKVWVLIIRYGNLAIM
jgi:hypothetical protein